jgi:heterodisulfide reductase subunit A
LAVGIRPPRQAVEIAHKLGINLNAYGFCETEKFSPLATSRSGVFVCGAFASPKEIAETILDGAGAAAEAMSMLRAHLGKRAFSRGQPFLNHAGARRFPRADEPSMAVALCECAGEIGDTVDLRTVAQNCATLPGVRAVEIVPLACLPEGKEQLRHLLTDSGANRLIVGACSPRTHEPLFQHLAADAGLHPYLTEMVNLREQCAWVHRQDPAGATHRAFEKVRLSAERLTRARPIEKIDRAPQRAALIVGGGLSGMTAALSIADAGFQVHLVERSNALGGNLHHVYFVAEGDNPQRLLRDLVNRTVAHERIQLHLQSQVIQTSGSVGAFQTIIRTETECGLRTEIRHGAAILATEASRPPSALRLGRIRACCASRPSEISSISRAGRLAALGSHDPMRPGRHRPGLLLARVLYQHHQERDPAQDAQPILPGGGALQEHHHLRFPRAVPPRSPPARRALRPLHR